MFLGINGRDRRYSNRTPVNVDALIYNPVDCTEIPCTVTNISEGGCCLVVSGDTQGIENIKKGSIIDFQFFDEYTYLNKHKQFIIANKGSVRHVEIQGDDVIFGIMCNDRSLKKYAEELDTARFMHLMSSVASYA